MKHLMKKAALCFLCCILLFGLFGANSDKLSAHEIAYDGTTPLVLKWAFVTNRTANLKINGDSLSSAYSSHYNTAKNAWPNASARVSVTQVDFNSSNVDIATASEEAWDDRYGWKASEYFGVCDIISTDGYELNSVSNIKQSSRLIRYAGILYTPYTHTFKNETHMKKTMVHEIGHALGLGHPDSGPDAMNVASVMNQGSNVTYFTPQAHDINDLNNKY